MGDVKVIGRSFGWRKMACGAFITAINLCIVAFLLKPYLLGLPSIINGVNVDHINDPTIINSSNLRSDMYDIKGDIRIHGISSTIFISSSNNQNLSSWTIQPYPQRNVTINKIIKKFRIKTEAPNRVPPCDRSMADIPAIVFPGRAHNDNHFHAFSNILFPLFFTSHHFNRNVVFLVTYHYSPWITKYRLILEKLSKYDVFDIDKEDQVLCFHRMIVGLKTPSSLFIHPSQCEIFPLRDFSKLLRSTYSLGRESVHDHRAKSGDVSSTHQPQMLIISRNNSRKLMNEEDICDMARSLGFKVAMEQLPMNLSLVAKLVNSVDVVVGVHGAGLVNMVFLPENALVLQITPYGVDLEAKGCFEWAAQCLNLRYLEYKVTLNESTLPSQKLKEWPLVRKLHLDTQVYTNPGVIRTRKYGLFHTIYLDTQDVMPDLHRFRKTLLRALEIIRAN